MPMSLAMRSASGSTGTSKARMHAYASLMEFIGFPLTHSPVAAYSFSHILTHSRSRSSITPHRITSNLATGPMPMPDTGIGGFGLPSRSSPGLSKNWSSASSDPSVEACTYTPSSFLRTFLRMPPRSFMTSSLSSSMSSSSPHTSRFEPASARSIPFAQIFTPIAPLISLWCTYGVFTRISFIGWGVRSERICVTMGPSSPQTTTVSFSLMRPLTTMTSMVVPRPSMALTSSTVHSRFSWNMIFSTSILLGSVESRKRRSIIPSPEWAEVGTTLRKERTSRFSKKAHAFRPCSASCFTALPYRCSYSCFTWSAWISRVCWTGSSGWGSQP
mmetsp:Transcript_24665/g.37538  ORF Transcript_24665/g.37538 Transcript_24665/m.37538 type:complete len:330 (-) Transcript_24665:631-1620(-)